MKVLYNKCDEVVERLNKEFDIDIFTNSKERIYVDARSILVKIMRDDFFFKWTSIQEYFNSKGRDTKQHGTIMHLYNRFENVKRYEKERRKIYFAIMNEMISDRLSEEMIDRIRHIEDPDKFFELEKALDKIGI